MNQFRNSPFEVLRDLPRSQEEPKKAELPKSEAKEPQFEVDPALVEQISQGLGADPAMREKIEALLIKAGTQNASDEIRRVIFDNWDRKIGDQRTPRDQVNARYEAERKLEPIIDRGREASVAQTLRMAAETKDAAERKRLIDHAHRFAGLADNTLKNIADKAGVSLAEWPEIEQEVIRPGKYEMQITAVNRKGEPVTAKQGVTLSRPGKDTAELEKQALSWISMIGLHNYGVPAGEVSYTLTHEKDPSKTFSFKTHITEAGHIAR
jgi:hypothetical protein